MRTNLHMILIGIVRKGIICVIHVSRTAPIGMMSMNLLMKAKPYWCASGVTHDL